MDGLNVRTYIQYVLYVHTYRVKSFVRALGTMLERLGVSLFFPHLDCAKRPQHPLSDAALSTRHWHLVWSP